MMLSNDYSVENVQQAAEEYFLKSDKGRGSGYKQFKRWEYNALRMQNESGFLKSSSENIRELERYQKLKNENTQINRASRVNAWEELGPKRWNQTTGWNPGVGRITSVAIDDQNPQHIIIGAPTGGVWKSTDGGLNWTVLTDNLSNIYVYSLAIHPNDSDTYFWGSVSGIIYKSTDGGNTWNLWSNTGSGVVNKILINPSNPNQMFFSAESGGIFKSNDGGSSWDLIHENATTGFDVEFNANDLSTIYASGNNLFRSSDGGESFTMIDYDIIYDFQQEHISGNISWILANRNGNNTVTPLDGDNMLMFISGSWNGDQTMLITPPMDLSGLTTPTLKFNHTSVSWSGDVDELKVKYRNSSTSDWIELASFTEETAAWQEQNISLPDVSNDYYIAFEAKSNWGRGVTLDLLSVYDVSDGAVVFSENFEAPLDALNLFDSGPKMIGVSPDNPDVVYMVEASDGIFGGLYKSTNGGLNFLKLDHGSKNYFGYKSDGDDLLGQAPRDMDIVVNPNNIDDVHIAGILSWRSTDGGINFTVSSQWIPERALEENIGYCHADIDIMLYKNDKLYIGSDGGLYVANNPLSVSSTYYRDLTRGMGIRQFYKIGTSQTNPVIVSGGSQDNGTSVVRNNGIWYDWLGADGMETFVDHSNPNVLYGTVQFGTMFKSDDMGSSVSILQSPLDKDGNWVTPFEQDPVQSNTIYVGLDIVYKSTTGGEGSTDHWQPISQSFGNNLDCLKIAPNDNQVMYASYANKIYKTTNGGATDWIELTGTLGRINDIAIHPYNPNKIAVATTSSNNKIYLSSDGGLNWQSARYDLPSFAALCLVWQENLTEDILYLGMNYGVYYLKEGAAAWVPYSNNLPNVIINELEINYADETLYAGTYGRGLWRIPTLDQNGLGVTKADIEDLKLYPNPSSGKFKISWNKSDPSTVKLFDSYGKLLFYGKNRDLSNGGLEIDLSLASGIYFVKINTISQEITKKLIIE